MAKSNAISSFKPVFILKLLLSHREYRNQHSLTIETCFFNNIDNVKLCYSLIHISKPKEKPIIITISVKVILYDKVVLFWHLLLNSDKCFTNIAGFKIRVYAILNEMVLKQIYFNLELFKGFPVVINQRVNTF